MVNVLKTGLVTELKKLPVIGSRFRCRIDGRIELN